MEKRVSTIVESPCVRNCCLNEADICVGCFRSLEEITRWSVVDNEAKIQILTRVAVRRSQARHKPDIGDHGADK